MAPFRGLDGRYVPAGLFGYDETAGVVEDWMYETLSEKRLRTTYLELEDREATT
jgi:hypothetical protein